MSVLILSIVILGAAFPNFDIFTVGRVPFWRVTWRQVSMTLLLFRCCKNAQTVIMLFFKMHCLSMSCALDIKRASEKCDNSMHIFKSFWRWKFGRKYGSNERYSTQPTNMRVGWNSAILPLHIHNPMVSSMMLFSPNFGFYTP